MIFDLFDYISKTFVYIFMLVVTSNFSQNMKHMLKTPEVVVDSSTMHKVPIEKERVQENKGTATPKKVPFNLILF